MDLESVEMIMAVEQEFMIEIADKIAECMVSIGDLQTVVESELKRANRTKDIRATLDRIAEIAARFAKTGKDGIGPETKLAEDLGFR